MAENDTTQAATPPTNSVYDYDSVRAPIPLEQPLFFCTNLAEGTYLPSQYTSNENDHMMPKGWARILFEGRMFQHAWIKQGESGNQHFTIMFLTPDGDWEDFSKYVGDGIALTNKLIHFEGTDADGNYIRSDEGFDVTQANLGQLGWKPEPIISQSVGHFKSAHFIIESVDRSRAITTLDFDLEIIGNSSIMPVAPKYQFYISEFERTLFSIKNLVNAGQDQLSYYNSIYAAIVKKKIDDLQEQMAESKKSIDDTVNDSRSQVTNMIKEEGQNIDALIKDANDKLKTSQEDLSSLENSIKSDKLVTQDNATEIITQILNGEDVKLNDPDDENIETRLNKIDKELGEAN